VPRAPSNPLRRVHISSSTAVRSAAERGSADDTGPSGQAVRIGAERKVVADAAKVLGGLRSCVRSGPVLGGRRQRRRGTAPSTAHPKRYLPAT
jgi:hypothetical protein